MWCSLRVFCWWGIGFQTIPSQAKKLQRFWVAGVQSILLLSCFNSFCLLLPRATGSKSPDSSPLQALLEFLDISPPSCRSPCVDVRTNLNQTSLSPTLQASSCKAPPMHQIIIKKMDGSSGFSLSATGQSVPRICFVFVCSSWTWPRLLFFYHIQWSLNEMSFVRLILGP